MTGLDQIPTHTQEDVDRWAEQGLTARQGAMLDAGFGLSVQVSVMFCPYCGGRSQVRLMHSPIAALFTSGLDHMRSEHGGVDPGDLRIQMTVAHHWPEAGTDADREARWNADHPSTF